MTQDERTKLRELLEQTTPGPWNYWHRDMTFGGHAVVGFDNFDALIYGDKQRNVGPTMRRTDAAFIVATRNALPSILDALDSKDLEIARLTARCAALERAIMSGCAICRACTHYSVESDREPCSKCRNGGVEGNRTQRWEFDEARFAAKEGS